MTANRTARRALLPGIILALAAAGQAQFGRAGLRGAQVATPDDVDGRFHYCRVFYRQAMDGSGGSWATDYPNADINFSIRLSELTRTNVSKGPGGDPNHLVVQLGGDELFQCPLVILSAPGAAQIDAGEAARLRA